MRPTAPDGSDENILLGLVQNGAMHTYEGREQRTLIWERMRWAKFRCDRKDGSLFVERDGDSMKSGRGDTSINTTLAVGVVARVAVATCLNQMYGDAIGEKVAKALPVVVQGDDNFIFMPIIEHFDVAKVYEDVFKQAGYEIDVGIFGLDNYGAPLAPVCSALIVPVVGVQQRFLPAQRIGRVIARYFVLPKTIGRKKRLGHMKMLALNLVTCGGHVFILRWLAQAVIKQLDHVEAEDIYDRDNEYKVTYSYPSVVGLNLDATDKACALFLENYYCAKGAPAGFLVGSIDSLREYLSRWKIGDWFEHPVLVTMAEIDA